MYAPSILKSLALFIAFKILKRFKIIIIKVLRNILFKN